MEDIADAQCPVPPSAASIASAAPAPTWSSSSTDKSRAATRAYGDDPDPHGGVVDEQELPCSRSPSPSLGAETQARRTRTVEDVIADFPDVDAQVDNVNDLDIAALFDSTEINGGHATKLGYGDTAILRSSIKAEADADADTDADDGDYSPSECGRNTYSAQTANAISLIVGSRTSLVAQTLSKTEDDSGGRKVAIGGDAISLGDRTVALIYVYGDYVRECSAAKKGEDEDNNNNSDRPPNNPFLSSTAESVALSSIKETAVIDVDGHGNGYGDGNDGVHNGNVDYEYGSLRILRREDLKEATLNQFLHTGPEETPFFL